MTIIESWEKSKQLAVADTQKPDVTEDWRSMRYAAVTILSSCIAEFQDATTPREPEPEWFDRWPVWWIKSKNEHVCPSGLVFVNQWDGVFTVDGRMGFNGMQDGCGFTWWLDGIEKCLPMQATDWKDTPTPVGWQVLERSNS